MCATMCSFAAFDSFGWTLFFIFLLLGLAIKGMMDFAGKVGGGDKARGASNIASFIDRLFGKK